MREMSRDFAASSYRAAKGSLEAAEYLAWLRVCSRAASLR